MMRQSVHVGQWRSQRQNEFEAFGKEINSEGGGERANPFRVHCLFENSKHVSQIINSFK